MNDDPVLISTQELFHLILSSCLVDKGGNERAVRWAPGDEQRSTHHSVCVGWQDVWWAIVAFWDYEAWQQSNVSWHQLAYAEKSHFLQISWWQYCHKVASYRRNFCYFQMFVLFCAFQYITATPKKSGGRAISYNVPEWGIFLSDAQPYW